MITPEEVRELIVAALPDAGVEAHDYSGTLDHYNVRVTSSNFSGLTLIDQHRLVYSALGKALQDGRLHAIQIQTIVPEESKAHGSRP